MAQGRLDLIKNTVAAIVDRVKKCKEIKTNKKDSRKMINKRQVKEIQHSNSGVSEMDRANV